MASSNPPLPPPPGAGAAPLGEDPASVLRSLAPAAIWFSSPLLPEEAPEAIFLEEEASEDASGGPGGGGGGGGPAEPDGLRGGCGGGTGGGEGTEEDPCDTALPENSIGGVLRGKGG